MHIKLCHVQNPGTFRTQGIFKNLSNQEYDQVYSELCHSEDNLFKHFQLYVGILKDIDAYLATLTGVQLGGKWGGPPLPFFENRKECPE